MLATYIHMLLLGVRNTPRNTYNSGLLDPDVARGGIPLVGLLERDLIKGTALVTFKHVL